MINLISNSIKFVTKGYIKVYAYYSFDCLWVSVIDTGPGISYEDQKHLFKMFSKLSATKDQNKTGCGLGLTICKKIIEFHNGLIQIESTLGLGSTFKFHIPTILNADSDFDSEADSCRVSREPISNQLHTMEVGNQM